MTITDKEIAAVAGRIAADILAENLGPLIEQRNKAVAALELCLDLIESIEPGANYFSESDHQSIMRGANDARQLIEKVRGE